MLEVFCAGASYRADYQQPRAVWAVGRVPLRLDSGARYTCALAMISMPTVPLRVLRNAFMRRSDILR